jgi:hypothetical protein
LRLNKNAFLIGDRDGNRSDEELNETKKRVVREIGDTNSWFTMGREIENYLTKKTLCLWLGLDKVKLDENKKLEDIIPKSKKIKYSANKTKFSKEIINYIELEDLEILDLKTQLENLITKISKWNGKS